MTREAQQLRIQGETIEIHPEHPVRVVCMEHVEQELDDYVNDYEVAPDTFKRAEVEGADLSERCMVCGEAGQIVLMHVKGN